MLYLVFTMRACGSVYLNIMVWIKDPLVSQFFCFFYLSGRKPQTYFMHCWFQSSAHTVPKSPNSVVNKSISGCSQFLVPHWPLPALSTLRWRRWRTT